MSESRNAPPVDQNVGAGTETRVTVEGGTRAKQKEDWRMKLYKVNVNSLSEDTTTPFTRADTLVVRLDDVSEELRRIAEHIESGNLDAALAMCRQDET